MEVSESLPGGPGPGEPEPAAPSERALPLLGLALGLVLVLLVSLAPLSPGPRQVDGAEELNKSFEPEAVLGGFQLTESTHLGDGRLRLRFEDPGAPPAEPWVDPPGTPEPPARSKSGGRKGRGGGGDHGGFGGWKEPNPMWVELPKGEEGRAPRELSLIRYPRGRWASVFREQFTDLEFKDLTRLDDDGETVPVDSGRLDWFGYEPQFVHLRHFRRVKENDDRPTFHDTLRVNLTRAGECWVLYLRWDERTPGSRDFAEQVLKSLRPREDPI